MSLVNRLILDAGLTAELVKLWNEQTVWVPNMLFLPLTLYQLVCHSHGFTFSFCLCFPNETRWHELFEALPRHAVFMKEKKKNDINGLLGRIETSEAGHETICVKLVSQFIYAFVFDCCCFPCSQGRNSGQICSHGWRNNKSLPEKVLFLPSFYSVSLLALVLALWNSTVCFAQISGGVNVCNGNRYRLYCS